MNFSSVGCYYPLCERRRVKVTLGESRMRVIKQTAPKQYIIQHSTPAVSKELRLNSKADNYQMILGYVGISQLN